MSAADRRTVITGVGILSPIGSDPSAFWSALLAGRSGIRPITFLDPSQLPSQIAGEIPDFDGRNYLDKKQARSLKLMARSVQMGLAVAMRAAQSSELQKSQVDPLRFGVVYGCGMIATELEDLTRASKLSVNCKPGALDLIAWGQKGLKEIPPLWMLKYLPNMPACHASIMLDAQGPNNSITANEVASLLAIGEAYRVIGRGLADVMLAGGAESKINALSLTRQNLFLTMSKRNHEPSAASRPFDKGRDGLVVGEGGAAIQLEELGFAEQRKANILAEVVGFASGFDRARDGRTLAKTILRALADAGITPADIDHVNAHGLSTPREDAWEAAGIAEVFGPNSVPVFAGKSYFGNLGAAGGALETVVSVLALSNALLPGTLNYETPDPACPVSVHTGTPRPLARTHALKISFTDMGQCAALVLRRWE